MINPRNVPSLSYALFYNDPECECVFVSLQVCKCVSGVSSVFAVYVELCVCCTVIL